MFTYTFGLGKLFSLPLKVPVTCSQKSLPLSCFPLKVRISTLRLCSVGSRCLLFPGVIAHMRCSDFLIIFGRSSGSPRC